VIGPIMTVATNSDEQRRRRRYMADMRLAVGRNQTIEEMQAARAELIATWTRWFRDKMAEECVDDALELLPMALGELEQRISAGANFRALRTARETVQRMLSRAIEEK
jgi:hypothetical protein